jgi:hypothetical protein
MQTPLARYGAPIAIVAGALMIITRLVVLFTTPAEIASTAVIHSAPTASSPAARSMHSRSPGCCGPLVPTLRHRHL